MQRRRHEREERRVCPVTVAGLRAVDGDGDEGARVEGYAAVFDTDSVDMGFVEQIAPGAFAPALARSDVRALWNHDSNLVLGRSAAGTLALEEDDHGLRSVIHPPDTQAGRDAVTSIRRGDVTGMSFAFTVAEDEWETDDAGVFHRRITEFDQLFDVSPVTYPAYPETDVAVRSMERAIAAGTLPAPGSDEEWQLRLAYARERLRLAEAEA